MRMTHAAAAVAVDGSVSRAKYFTAAKPCDFCKSAAALLFCRPHSAFMCIACDAKIHTNGTTGGDKHGRVWMCEVCEQAPAAVTCKADAAALCLTCDRDIHCANPLANRHDRVPVVPFHDLAENIVLKSTTADFPCGDDLFGGGIENCYIPDSWISLPQPPPSSPPPPPPTTKLIHSDTPDLKSLELLLQDSDQFLDFDNRHQLYNDSVVPVQPHPAVKPPVYASENRFEIDFTRSNIGSYNSSYTTQSLSHSVSSSSMEVGVVPDGNSPSEMSYPLTGNLNSGGNLDREARVLRYREKRKNRKFEKTIRYASRKAYAETRPRVKGRFAKRTDVDRVLGVGSADFIADGRYGVVPSF